MIWALLEALEQPHLWAMTKDKDGVIHLAPVDVLEDNGRKVVGTPKDSK